MTDSYRVNLRLDPQHDRDLIDWLEELPHGARSQIIRDTLRAGLMHGQDKGVDLTAIRQAVAEEVRAALKRAVLQVETTNTVTNDVEGQYGDRLDRMLGGLGGQ